MPAIRIAGFLAHASGGTTEPSGGWIKMNHKRSSPVQLAPAENRVLVEVAPENAWRIPAFRTMAHFIRYIVHQRIRWQPARVGLFAAAYHVRRSSELLPHHRSRLDRCLDWFGRALTTPPLGTIPAQAIFWYADAAPFSEQMWELARIVEDYGFTTELITSRSVGRIVYRDTHQLAAIPPRRGNR
jgi:hypothetical protein